MVLYNNTFLLQFGGHYTTGNHESCLPYLASAEDCCNIPLVESFYGPQIAKYNTFTTSYDILNTGTYRYMDKM